MSSVIACYVSATRKSTRIWKGFWKRSAWRSSQMWTTPKQRAGTPLPSLPVRIALFAEPFHRDDALGFRGVEHDHAAGLAALDADLGDAATDELAAVGDQHQLVLLLDRKRADQAADLGAQRAVALAVVHGDDAFAAAAGGAVFERGGALAVAALGNRQHELLGRR